jgi:hypothetical protein
MTPAATLIGPASNPALYAASVLTLYVDLVDTPERASTQDLRLARRLFDEGVPLELVETALLLASLRRMNRPPDAPPLSPIRSLAYFQPVIAELREHPVSTGYLDYLRRKVHSLSKTHPAGVQKTTFSHDR